MAVFKCKMCGGALEVHNNESVAECEYCGTKQTLPTNADEVITNLFNRANNLRMKCEFDKAMQIYEKIVERDDSEAEAHWGIVLCKYGIEYVEDPQTMVRIPTCHRTSFESITKDMDYIAAIDYSDSLQQVIYEKEARAIDKIQKDILAVVNKEEPFDIFICYKETDENGKRTVDSVIANDIYHQLTQEGFKVFYAAITLEDKLGQEYEPYIFAALNSAKVMLAIGTKPEYFKAVWVHNEWSRYLSLIKQGQNKILIPAYKDMDPYDLPEEFSHLQAQDMSKLGFMQDLIRGVKKIARAEEPKAMVVKETIIADGNSNTASLLKRVFMFLEDGDWKSANEYCEKVLDIKPENAEAYLGKLLSELRVRKQDELKNQAVPFDSSNNYKKVIRFGDEKLKTVLMDYIEHINTRNENARLDGIYTCAKNMMSVGNTESAYKEAARLFESISEYLDSIVLAKECYKKANKSIEDKEKCDALFKAFKFMLENKRNGKDPKVQAEKSISEHTQRLQQLLAIQSKWNQIEANISSYNHEIQIVQAEISKLDEEKTELSFFEGKKRKEISLEIKSDKERIRSLKEKLLSEEENKGGFLSIELLNKEISQMEERINVQNRILTEISGVVDSYEIRKELSCYAYGEQLLSNYSSYFDDLIEVGGCIKFGSYQKEKTGGKEDIEWLVLDVEDNKALVISKYALDCKSYNAKDIDVTWETCSLRKWLNNEFINSAFSVDENAMIPMVTIFADKNPKYGTNPGKATQEQVFLLSIVEVNKYFNADSAKRCKPTDFAVANGAYLNRDNSNCYWWLRSPGEYQNKAAVVCTDGIIYESGSYDYAVNRGVRPAMWIDLNIE